MTRTTQAERIEHVEQRQATSELVAPGQVVIGLVAGLLGALVIAVYFFAIDVFQGRPLWTPSALGSVVFLGERLPPDADWRPMLVLGYTVLHAAVFLASGRAASLLLDTLRHLPRSDFAIGAIVTLVLFGAFELIFIAMALVFAPEFLGDLGSGQVAAANLLAAASMAAFLSRYSPRRASAEGAAGG